MQQRDWTEFGGVAGTVLYRSLSLSSLISGMAMGFALAIVVFIAAVTQAPAIANPVAQILVALFLARYAVNGLYGEWNGTVFSGAGGSWGHVTQVALRYLMLTALWAVPLFLGGLKGEQVAAAAMGMAGPKILAMFGIYLVLSTLTPPLFLVVSVTADGFSDIFSPSHWHANLAGRRNDLFSLYSVYSGALGVALLLAVLPVAGAFMLNVKLGFVATAIAGAFLFGLMVNLLGRLSGFFACGELGTEPPLMDREPDPGEPPAPPIDMPETAAPASATPSAPVPVPLSADPSPIPGATGKLPPLLDAKQRVDRALRRFQTDPQGVIIELESLRKTYAPHPQVLQAMAICLYKGGNIDAGLAMAVEALPLCFERGHIHLSAEIFSVMKAHFERLGLGREERVSIAIALDRTGDLAGAAKAYSTVIDEDAGELRSVRGMLGVADRILNERQKPDAAARVYDYLLKRCAGSPLEEFMHEGLNKAQGMQEATAATVG